MTSRIDPFVPSDVSDAQNCGKMQILAPARATLSSLRTCWTLKTVVKCKFWMWPSNPFVTSDVSDAQNCGKTRILRLTMATLSWFRACWTFKIVVKCKLLMSPSDPFVTSCGLGAQNCSKIQYFVVRSSTMATLSWLRACWTFKIVVKCKLVMSPSDPFVPSCGLGAQNCSKI